MDVLFLKLLKNGTSSCIAVSCMTFQLILFLAELDCHCQLLRLLTMAQKLRNTQVKPSLIIASGRLYWERSLSSRLAPLPSFPCRSRRTAHLDPLGNLSNPCGHQSKLLLLITFRLFCQRLLPLTIYKREK